MNNTLIAELAFELLRIHLGRHDILPEIDPLRAAAADQLVEFRGVIPVLTETGVESINRIVDALFEGMEAK